MNPIDELRAARPAHLGDAPIDERTRSAELSHAMSRPRTAPRRRARVRPVWGVGLAGAAAAVTAVAVVMAGNGATPPRAPDPGRSAVAADPSGAPATTLELSPRQILLAAAEKAAEQPDGSGDYWHTASVRRTLFAVEDGDYLVMDQQRDEMWTPNAPGRDQWARSQTLGVRPATDADEKAWREAGSPTDIPVPVGDKPAPMTLSTSPGKLRIDRMPLVNGDKVFWLGRNVSMKDLRALPDDPARLKAWLLRSYEGHGTESSDTPMSADSWLFTVAAGLITDMPVTPEVRGAAFRMLADLDGVEVVQNVTDAEGRQGTAVTIKETARAKAGDKGEAGLLETRLIFDENTGRALGTDSVVVKPGGFQTAFEPGTVWHSVSIVEAGWTDANPGS